MANDFDSFAKELRDHAAKLRQLVNRRLPIKAGQIAKRHFQDNFRLGGFVDNGLHPWQPAKRLSQGGTSAAAKYPTLLSSRKHLYSGINYTPGMAQVRIFNDIVYASIHQNGGEISIPVTPKMRRYAWARYYAATNKEKTGEKGEKSPNTATSEEAKMWKGLALTKKERLSVTMPARPFIGSSRELDEKLSAMIETEITNILNH